MVWGWGSDGPNMYICNVAWQNFKGRLLGVSMFLPFSASSSQLLCDKWFNQLGINQRLPVSLSLPLGNSCREESFHIYDTFYLPPQQLSDLWWLCASTLCFLFAFIFCILNIVSRCFVFFFDFRLWTHNFSIYGDCVPLGLPWPHEEASKYLHSFLSDWRILANIDMDKILTEVTSAINLPWKLFMSLCWTCLNLNLFEPTRFWILKKGQVDALEILCNTL